MEQVLTPSNMVILFSLLFFAGLVDSVAGGGGIISLPAYMFIGLPAHVAMGCNKFSASMGTLLAMARFWKNRALDLKIGAISACGSFIAAYIGSSVALIIDEDLLKKIFVIVLPFVAVIILNKRQFGDENFAYLIEEKKAYLLALLIGLLIGFYDGLIGPGTGTFAIIAYCAIMRYDLKTASGNAKVLNTASGLASVIRFIISGKIVYAIAIPAAFFSITGSYIGAGLAIRKGSRFIKPMMILVITLLFSKMLFQDILHII